ncbi:hypothetical protein CY0110_16467 [Crocosphaera chwakensis CCY0110]|uniref:Uncharacterized protein n=1 Tax=Crocosphaera chwakensis CCY0110 TaxID=391612 RepID=A3IHX5_9CHRO|nr:hypothetical protein CY0110_16467 [Crocosphaera chwakensis CCY0110]
MSDIIPPDNDNIRFTRGHAFH